MYFYVYTCIYYKIACYRIYKEIALLSKKTLINLWKGLFFIMGLTRVELSTTQHTYSTYTHVYFFTSFFKYITQVQFRCVHNLYTCIHMWTYQTYTQLLKPIISKANCRIFHPFYGLVTKNKQKTTWMAEIIISCWF